LAAVRFVGDDHDVTPGGKQRIVSKAHITAQ
jgi:hypothetical protein